MREYHGSCGDRDDELRMGEEECRGFDGGFDGGFSRREEAGIGIKRCNKLQKDEGPAKRVVMRRDDRRKTFSSK